MLVKTKNHQGIFAKFWYEKHDFNWYKGFHGKNGPNWPDFKEKNSKSPDILMIVSHN